MITTDKKINMQGQEICLYCPKMNPNNGYCQRVGEFVNAFWSCKGFDNKEEVRVEAKPKKHFVSWKKGKVLTAGRTEKRCARCGQVKPIDQFVRSSKKADGHDCYCRECNAIRHREAKQKKLLTQ